MKIWSVSAIYRYYRDPVVEFHREGDGGKMRPDTVGYYIVLHCEPDCCQAFGGSHENERGPFATRVKAHNWSRMYLVEPGEATC